MTIGDFYIHTGSASDPSTVTFTTTHACTGPVLTFTVDGGRMLRWLHKDMLEQLGAATRPMFGLLWSVE